MSKGMSNLIKMTHAAQDSKIFLHVGYNSKNKFCKMSSDVDCLPPDCTNYRTAQFDNLDDLKGKVKRIEELGYEVCIDTPYYSYETEGANEYTMD